MKPKIEELWVDMRRSMNSAQVNVTCCNEVNSVYVTDGDTEWTCPICKQTIKFKFGGLSFEVMETQT